MTNIEIQKRPILTLGGNNKSNVSVTEDHPILLAKETTSKSTEALSTSETKTNNTKLQILENTSNSDPKIKLEKEPVLSTTTETVYDFNAIYDELHMKLPNIINMRKPVLLAHAIRGELLKQVSAPNAVMYKWIAWYFRKSNYYSIHELGAIRYNLDGTEAGTVTEKDQAKRDKQMLKMKAFKAKSSNKNSNNTIQKK
jgi:hypothetical protein